MAKKNVSAQVQGVQQLRRSGAAGSHKGHRDVPRAQQVRTALEEGYGYWSFWTADEDDDDWDL